MSLLDQLSSLCIPSASSNYQPSFFSFNLDPPSTYLPSLSANQPSSAQKHEPTSQTKQSQIHNSQQKMIKLFDDEQLKPTWKLIKTDKKPNPQPKIQTSQQKNLSQFTVNHPKKDNQIIFAQFTKVFHLFNTKLRKINYELFVKLQKYSNKIVKQRALKQEEVKKTKISTFQKGIRKLEETIKIINLKYVQPQYEQLWHQNVKDKKNKAFFKIKSVYMIEKKFSYAERCMKKQVYRKFIVRLQQRNKAAIKIDLFTALLESIVKKKNKQNVGSFFEVLRHQTKNEKVLSFNNYKWIPYNYEKERQRFLQPQIYHPQIQQNYSIQLRISCPIGYLVQKSQNPHFSFQTQLNLQSRLIQNIPLKLHNLKAHQQQTNLNDCIDNGHLLMNQIKNNTSFRQQLDNLTISNINSNTTNTSVNSSLLAYDNLILPPSIEDKDDFVSYSAITMRKQSRPSEDVVPVSEEVLVKEVKKSRNSLVITKRKESANDILSYGQVMANSQKQKISFDPIKPKSTATSGSKITQKQSNGDKQVIKRMLDQLNKKFACDDRVIKISLSNKKQTSNERNQKSQYSGKNLQRKKIKSQVSPVTKFNEKLTKKETDKKLAQKQSYRIDLTEKKEQEKKCFYQQKKKPKSKTSDNCFMSVTLNKISKNAQSSKQQKPAVDYKNLIQQRTKQSHSQMLKQNLNVKCPSQSSQYNEICKILSKYRSKKPLIPQCCMKIDLVTSKVNKVLSLAEKNGKDKNKIFFNNNDSKLDKTQDYKLHQESIGQLGDNNLSVSKTYSRPSEDTYMIKPNSMNHLSSQTDSVMREYVFMLPSNIYFNQNQEENDCPQSAAEKPTAVNNSLDASECFFTDSRPRLSNKPSSVNTSIDKNRVSFEQNLQEWDMMFEKQKSKFLKNDNKIKRKSTLNEEVISEIKNKIEQCLILGHKDTNVAKGLYLQLKKGSQEKNFLNEKNVVMSSNKALKMLSSSNSNRNSINKLFQTNKLTKRIEG